MDLFFRTRKYFSYWLDEVNEHSLHSPFLFNLYRNVIAQKNQSAFSAIEDLRRKLQSNDEIVTYKDPGASGQTRHCSIKQIATASLSDSRYSLLYYRLIQYANPEFVVELGTSLGINTLYMAEAGRSVYTFEGAAPLAALSKKHFKQQQKDNIHLIEGNIDTTLPEFISKQKHLPFIFFDANHTYEATMRYFKLCLAKATEESIFIFDDIYWSKGMGKAWEEIKAHDRVRVTLDLYRCGIVFFNSSLTRQHLAVKF